MKIETKSDDITYCMSERCTDERCSRHKNNLKKQYASVSNFEDACRNFASRERRNKNKKKIK